MNIFIAILVMAATAGVYFCDAKYTRALIGDRLYLAGMWAVTCWGAATFGFIIAVKLSMWYLPFEGAGVFLGVVASKRNIRPVS